MEKLKTWIIVILVAICLVVAAFSITQINRLNRQLDIDHQNLIALTDTIHSLEMKNGETLDYTTSLILDKNQLEKELADERLDRKEIERQLRSKISQLTKTIAEFKMDTIIIVDTIEVTNDSAVIAQFKYSDEWTQLEGQTKIYKELAQTLITRLSVDVPLTIGQTDDYQVFVHSQNPWVNLTLLQNSISSQTIEDKAFRRLSLGIYGGVGFSYGWIRKEIDFGPQFGIGLNYRLW